MYNFDHLCVMESLKPNVCLRSYFIPQHFSSCSTGSYADYLNNKNPECVLNMPELKDLIQPPVCGNRVSETGEECDCGTVQVSRLRDSYIWIQWFEMFLQQIDIKLLKISKINIQSIKVFVENASFLIFFVVVRITTPL